MKIYVACLASYNNGRLHGRWIDADSSVDVMQEQVDAMLRESPYPNVMRADYLDGFGNRRIVTHSFGEPFGPTIEDESGTWRVDGNPYRSAEEFAIHDMEGLPGSFGEYVGLQTVADYVALVEEFDHIDADAIAGIYDDFRDIEETRKALENSFIGVYSSFRDYADEVADEMLESRGSKDDTLSRYFDYEAFARDLKMDMRVVDVPSGVAIFYA